MYLSHSYDKPRQSAPLADSLAKMLAEHTSFSTLCFFFLSLQLLRIGSTFLKCLLLLRCTFMFV